LTGKHGNERRIMMMDEDKKHEAQKYDSLVEGRFYWVRSIMPIEPMLLWDKQDGKLWFYRVGDEEEYKYSIDAVICECVPPKVGPQEWPSA
jgi:hypothetical protein